MLEHSLRPLFGYLRGVAIPTAVFAATEDWAGAGNDRSPSGSGAPPANSPR